MKSKLQAAVAVLSLAAGISTSCQTRPTCPVTITFIKLTPDRYKIKVLGHSTKPREDPARLMLTVYVVDDQNHTRMDTISTLEESSYTYTGVWNTGEAVQQGRFILRVVRFMRDTGALPIPVDGCSAIERTFDFKGTEDRNKPTAKS